MRIVMFTDHFYPELGGIQDSVMLTARSLGARGHGVEIFAPRHPEADFRRVGHDFAEPELGANVVIHRRMSWRVTSSTQQSRAAVPSPASLLALLGRRRPDVIHSHSFFGLGLEALIAGRVLGVPVVGTNHTNVLAFGPYIPVPVERAADWVVGYYNRCDAITAPSRAVFAELGQQRLRHTPQIVSNPIDTQRFHPAVPGERDRLRAEFGLAGPLVVYAGRLAAEKNIEAILHAIALLPEGPGLALAGHGAHETALRQLAGELGIVHRVAFLGTLAPDRLAELFRAADLFVMMSTSETQSMASLQAMASGLPVVATNSGALAEFVTSTTGQPADPHNPVAIATAIGRLLADPDLRSHQAEAARSLACRHSIDAVTDVWERLYQSMQPRSGLAWSTQS